MAKQGMKRFDPKHEKNPTAPVPEISGKAKSGKEKASPLIAGIPGAQGKVYHSVPHSPKIPDGFGAIDNDLALENLKNDFDLTEADLQDFEGRKG